MHKLRFFACFCLASAASKTFFNDLLVDADATAAIRRVSAYRALAMVDFAKVILPNEDEIRAILEVVAIGPKAAADLVQTVPAERQAFVFRALAWLIKLGVLRAVV